MGRRDHNHAKPVVPTVAWYIRYITLSHPNACCSARGQCSNSFPHHPTPKFKQHFRPHKQHGMVANYRCHSPKSTLSPQLHDSSSLERVGSIRFETYTTSRHLRLHVCTCRSAVALYTPVCGASPGPADVSVDIRPVTLCDDVLEAAPAGDHGQHVLNVRHLQAWWADQELSVSTPQGGHGAGALPTAMHT